MPSEQTNTAPHPNPEAQADYSPLGLLRATAIRAFPEITALKTVSTDGSLIEVWKRMLLATHLNNQDFAKGIAHALYLKPAPSLIPQPSALNLIPVALARETLILPLEDKGTDLVVATALPFEGAGLDRVRFACGKNVVASIAPPEDIELAIHAAYSSSVNNAAISMVEMADADLAQSVSSNSIVQLANALMQQALKLRASDLHVQPFFRGSKVRVRVDGILRRIALIPDGVGEHLIRYFKAHSKMNPSVSNVPQDGRMGLNHQGRQIDLRLSVLPATGGERLVIRFLDQSRVYSLSDAGFSLASLQAMRRMLSNASGLILMTGPTGSGKSSTLYSMLNEINYPGSNIITIENPVEYRVAGISQVDVREDAGLTFPSVLRSCMRQDPDVLLVGEIRDEETAEIALQAAITGHLVLSTLHTNDAVTSVSRLLGLGVQPAIMADALVGVIAQRLVRRLCPHCKVPVTEPLNDEERLFKELTRIAPSHRAAGCDACGQTGYHGRLPVVEILEVTPEIAEMISEGIVGRLKLRSANHGKDRTLAGAAARLVVSGETTVYEAVRVVGREFWTDTASEFGSKPPLSIPILHEGRTSGQAILTLSADPTFIADVRSEADRRNIACFDCASPEEAGKLLHAHEDIAFVVVDLPDVPDAENLEFIRQARVAMYWSRLPALLLLPERHPQLMDALRADGAISEMLIKPLAASHVMERIKAYTSAMAVE